MILIIRGSVRDWVILLRLNVLRFVNLFPVDETPAVASSSEVMGLAVLLTRAT
jgi:hypothetical protein